ncbi:MAG: formate dehydrogenase accessory sulfurtransferase FdhD [Methylococcaceae bacterium]
MTLLCDELGWPAWQYTSVERWRGQEHASFEDQVAEETPVALVYNGEPHVVMLATPLDLEDFALGFSLTEGIVSDPEHIESIRVFTRSEGIEVRVRIPSERCDGLSDKGRNLTGRTGCGLCGAITLSQAIRKPPPVRLGAQVEACELLATLSELQNHQRLNQITGAVHAAAWVVPGTGIVQVREDVGRHNALDKLIGVLARSRTAFDSGYVLVTSRASFEMVQKCATMGIGLMAAISAPTGLAIRMACDVGLTLIGFARDDRYLIYSHPQRVLHTASACPIPN